MSDPSALRDEIALRRASIADAEREHRAGDLTSEALAALVAAETDRIDALTAALAASGTVDDVPAVAAATPLVPTTGRRRRRALLYVALACFVLAAVGVTVGVLTSRSSNGPSFTTRQLVERDLVEGELDESLKDDAAALYAFNNALTLDATNVEALTQSGWLTFSAGSADQNLQLVRTGIHEVERAVKLAPADPDPRLYYAIIAASTPGETTLAMQQFKVFLRLKPSSTDLALAAPWLSRLKISS